MSASLVGSEMCIRDRPAGLGTENGGLQDRNADGARLGMPQQQPRDSAEPVSYTHLTLPTICSV
eukprot:8118073-Alexandrium_andersonii.AAC.1